MEQNDFYEVDGCIDFIPVKIVGKSEDGVIVAQTNDKRDCQLVVEEVYRLQKVHEPQKVVVQKFVAEWIDYVKKQNFSLKLALGNWLMSEKLEKWLQYSYNQDTFALAWIYGYEVEKEVE